MMNILLLLATSYWAYCTLFSVFVLVALFLEKRELNRCMKGKEAATFWPNYVVQSNVQEVEYCLERVYVPSTK